MLRIRIFLALGHFGHAAMLAQQFAEAAPERADLHFLAARALAKLGQIEKAKEHVRRVVELQPELRAELLECEDLVGI